jgi:predicted transcriptional regulator
MTKNEVLVRVASIVSTLAQTGGSPESMLYIFCNMDMQEWETIRMVLTTADLVKIQSHYVTLTENGKKTAEELNKRLKN